ncbi:hypothetical protein FKM82_012914 [Ascaphus truei]
MDTEALENKGKSHAGMEFGCHDCRLPTMCRREGSTGTDILRGVYCVGVTFQSYTGTFFFSVSRYPGITRSSCKSLLEGTSLLYYRNVPYNKLQQVLP